MLHQNKVNYQNKKLESGAVHEVLGINASQVSDQVLITLLQSIFASFVVWTN